MGTDEASFMADTGVRCVGACLEYIKTLESERDALSASLTATQADLASVTAKMKWEFDMRLEEARAHDSCQNSGIPEAEGDWVPPLSDCRAM